MGSSKYLIVGLGNIGAEYHNTRHNIGFMVLDQFIGETALSFSLDRHAEICQSKYKGRSVLLVKPTTYMNLSGKAVKYWLDKEKIPLENLLVIVDDLALPLGKWRMRKNGSDGGHNGLADIISTLGTSDFCRLRLGIGSNFAKGRQVDYVLGKWSAEEMVGVEEQLTVSADIIRTFVSIGIDRTMNQYNKK